MESVRNYILKEFESKNLTQEEAKKMLMELMEKPSPEADHQDIAIIGMACKFPDANSVDEYWSNLKSGVNSIKEPSKIRRDDSTVYYKNHLFTKYMLDFVVDDNADLDEQFTKGGYLSEIDKFDAGFFRIPPREAKFMEPLQRLFLETAWEAIEDAGYGGNKIVGTKTGVFAGRDNTAGSLYQYVSEPDQMHLTGSWAGIMASRIQYIFNLKGPGMVVDTACSSGLTATHMACRSLQQGDCDMAISGGIHLTYLPSLKDQKSSMDMLEAEDGKVKTFSKSANGTVWGEGVGILFLKPLSKALADGDNIHAVIKGSAINNDGASNGITAPNPDAQESVITNAWEEAKINPETISYIEAHGTGTILGDPIEIKGLTNAFRKYTDRNQFCGIGSVKTNFGHLVAASGMASIIKVILSLKNKMIPPTLHFGQPNPYIDFCNCPVFVNDGLRQWDTGDTLRRAGVSSFGFSGTNCHIVLEEAPEVVKRKSFAISKEKPKNIFTLSARSESVLKDFVNRYLEFIIKGKVTDLKDICFTANTGRGHFSNRLALVLKDFDDFKEKLLYVSRIDFKSLDKQGIYYSEHKIVPANKKFREPWEITETQRREMSAEADREIQELQIRKGDNSKLYDDICRLYVQGGSIDWDMLYKGQDVKRVSVPVYPLERIRYWAAAKDYDVEKQLEKEEKTIEHPLFDNLLADSIDRQILVTHFDNARHWALDEHRIQGKSVLPGITYLEMAREAAKAYYGESSVELRDIVFVSPLVVADGETKDVQTIIAKDKDHLDFAVVSKQSTEGTADVEKWITHSEGKIYRLGEKTSAKLNISELKKACSKEERTIKLSEVDSPIKFGTRWDNVEKIYVGNDGLFIKLSMDESKRDEVLGYSIYPSLMDNAANMIMTGLGNNAMYLPLSYHSMKVYDRMPCEFYSYIKKINNSNNSIETFSFDISLIDMEGKVFAEIANYTIKMVRNTDAGFLDPDKNSNAYYEINWIAEEPEMSNKQQNPADKTAVVFKDTTGLADKMISGLKGNAFEKIIEVTFASEYKKTGDTAFEISGSEEDYIKLMAELKPEGINEIIHLSTIADTEEAQNISLQESHKRGLYSLFYLTKALAANKYNSQVGLKLISEFVSPVNDEDVITNPDNSSFFGLAKVVAQENQNLNCRFIDIDRDTSLDSIINEVISDNKAQNVAYRKGARYVPEFSLTEIKTAQNDLEVKNEGVYVITGGTGGIGLEIARYFASKNHANIALINRTKLPDIEKWNGILEKNSDEKLCRKLKAIRSIEESGSKVVCFNGDIANEEETNKIICSLREKFGKINGIVHAAGVAGDGYIVLKDIGVFNEVISPKIEGTMILDKLTQNDEMDFFILLSSITSVTGGNGQGDYVAANSFENAFAQYRNKRGKRTIAINWPGWLETGMAFDKKVTSENFPFKSITIENGLDIFEETVKSGKTVVYTGKLNIPFLAAIGDRLPIKLSYKIKSLIDKYTSQGSKEEVRPESQDAASGKPVRGISSNAGSSLEKRLAVIWGEVLGIKEIDIYDNFHDMGGDSILATQLLKEIDKEYPDIISISDVFSYPSVSQLAEYMSRKTDVESAHLEAAVSTEDQISDLQTNIAKVELMPVQRCFFYRDFEEKNHWNECIPICMKEGIDESILRKVIREVMIHHDSLRLVFKQENGRYIQYLKTIDEISDNVFVFNVAADKIQLAAEALKLNKSIDLAEGPLVKFAVFKTDKGDYFYSIMHHLVIDGLSMQILMRDIISNYIQVLSGKEIMIPKESVSVVKWAEFLNNYALGDEISGEISYWDKVDSTPVERLPRDGTTESRKMKLDNNIYEYLLDEKETEMYLKDSCKHHRVTAEIILLTGLGMVLDRWGNMENVHIRLCGNGRDLPFSKFDLSRTVGWLSMSYPFLLHTGKGLSIENKVENTKKSLAEVPNMGAGYDILRFITNPARYPEKHYSVEPEIFFNYLGAYGEPELVQDDILLALSEVPEKSPESEREYVINIEGAIVEGKLKIHLEYNSNEYKKETMLEFLEVYKKVLVEIAETEQIKE